MKYKCIKPYWQYDVQVMDIGDLVTINSRYLYNITRKASYALFNTDKYMQCLEIITDELPYKIQDDVSRFEDITKKMLDIFKRKNHDYGNSFEQSLNEEGLAAARIRMGDKWNRFKQLSKGNTAQVNDESIADTLLDMANYAIITKIWLDKNQRNGNI